MFQRNIQRERKRERERFTQLVNGPFCKSILFLESVQYLYVNVVTLLRREREKKKEIERKEEEEKKEEHPLIQVMIAPMMSCYLTTLCGLSVQCRLPLSLSRNDDSKERREKGNGVRQNLWREKKKKKSFVLLFHLLRDKLPEFALMQMSHSLSFSSLSSLSLLSPLFLFSLLSFSSLLSLSFSSLLALTLCSPLSHWKRSCVVDEEERKHP